MSSLLAIVLVSNSQQRGFQEINPVLHDVSYISTFGTLPDESVSETARIRTHLSYVQRLLSETPTGHLSEKQSTNRNQILSALQEYLVAEKFPVNSAYPGERRPCFIDDKGTICAVGYLVEQTRGREMAEVINKNHQYDFLLEMNEPALEAWAEEYGLTLEECAMIQPTYGPLPDPQTRSVEIKPAYGVSSGIMGGANLGVHIFNMTNKGPYRPAVGIVGVITGTSQILLGVANIKKSTTEYWINGGQETTTYKKQNNLSYVNIAVGTSTLVTSIINLAVNAKKRDKRNTFNLYSYPDQTNSLAMGFSFTRRM